MTEKIFLARHGITDANVKRHFIGHSDLPLLPQGVEQAKSLRDTIALIKPNSVFASPLKRARQTAELACEGLNINIELEPDFKEADFGLWEHHSLVEMEPDYPTEADQWRAGDLDLTFPEGECMREFSERVNVACQRLKDLDQECVVVFAHAGVIAQAICHIMGHPAEQHISYGVPPASITYFLKFRGRYVMRSICGPDQLTDAR
jgi:broad specificity phosphatase PhoE